jgi:hypothetical protein
MEDLKIMIKKFEGNLDKKTEFKLDHASQLKMLFKRFEIIDEAEEEKRRKKRKEQEEFEASIMNSTVHSEINPIDLKRGSTPVKSSGLLPALQHLQHSNGQDGPKLNIALETLIEPSYTNSLTDKLPFLKK